MKRFLSLIAAAPLVAAACAGAGSDAPAPTATGDSELNILEIKCRDTSRIGGSHFDVTPGADGTLQGTLLTNEGEAKLVCHPSHVPNDAGEPTLVVSCIEEPDPGRKRENWTVDVITKPDGRQTAHIDRHQEIGGPEPVGDDFVEPDLACARIMSTIPVLPYSVVGGYINRTCNVCHDGRFDSLEKVRAERDLMLGMISAGIMPKRNPGWREQDEGKLTIQFLAKSPELD